VKVFQGRTDHAFQHSVGANDNRGWAFCFALAGPLRNANLTRGVANPAVAQDNIQDTISVSGWTDTIRPQSSYTTALKKKQIGQYHYKDKKVSSYEEDHLLHQQQIHGCGAAPKLPQV